MIRVQKIAAKKDDRDHQVFYLQKINIYFSLFDLFLNVSLPWFEKVPTQEYNAKESTDTTHYNPSQAHERISITKE
jgi:hypothetical protein